MPFIVKTKTNKIISNSITQTELKRQSTFSCSPDNNTDYRRIWLVSACAYNGKWKGNIVQ